MSQPTKIQRTWGLKIGIFALIGLMIGFIFVLIIQTPGSSSDMQPTIPSPINNGTEIKISLKAIKNPPKWYSYDSNGVEIRFIVALGSDDSVHLAADACDVCYRAKKGYRSSGNLLICNNCGNSFAINSIGTVNKGGGCWPSYIPINITETEVIIQISDLNVKGFMFQ